MKVLVTKLWYNTSKVMDVEDALTPETSNHDDTLCRMARDIEVLQDIVGRLLGHLVETSGMSLEDAQRIAGLQGDHTIEPHPQGEN